MAIATSRSELDVGLDVPRNSYLFKKKEVSYEVREELLRDYQYSDKTINQLSKEYGLSRYLINKIASEAEDNKLLVKRKTRNSLASILLRVNGNFAQVEGEDFGFDELSDEQMRHITNYSHVLGYKKNTENRISKVVSVSDYEDMEESKKETRLSPYESKIRGLLPAPVSPLQTDTALNSKEPSEYKLQAIRDKLELAIALKYYGSEEILRETGMDRETAIDLVRELGRDFRESAGNVYHSLTKLINEIEEPRAKRNVLEFAVANSEGLQRDLYESELLKYKVDEEYEKAREKIEGFTQEQERKFVKNDHEQQEKDKRLLEVAVGLTNHTLEEALMVLPEYSTLEDLDREMVSIQKRLNKGDSLLNNYLWHLATEDLNMEHRRAAAHFGTYHAPIEDRGNYNSIALELEQILNPITIKTPEDVVVKYLPGHEPGIFNWKYWKDGFFKRDLREMIHNPVVNIVCGLELGLFTLGLVGLNNMDHNYKMQKEKEKIEARVSAKKTEDPLSLDIYQVITNQFLQKALNREKSRAK